MSALCAEWRLKRDQRVIRIARGRDLQGLPEEARENCTVWLSGYSARNRRYCRKEEKTMTRRPRRNHSPAFKAKVALAVLKGEQTLAELAQIYDVRANQIKQWKDRLPSADKNRILP